MAFVLVSIDDDPERLARYVADRKFSMPVARIDAPRAEAALGVSDVPATFYVDRAGVIRYEARGVESHGDSAERVAWYIEELKRGRGDSPEDKRYRNFFSLMSDPLPYGMAANRPSIEALITYSLQQKLIPSRPQLDQVFVDIDP